MPRKKTPSSTKEKSSDGMISAKAKPKPRTTRLKTGADITYKDFEEVHKIVAQYQESQDRRYRDRVR